LPDLKTMTGSWETADLDKIRVEMNEILEAQRKLCHNINNPLTAIMGRSQILQLKQGKDPQVIKVVQVIEESAKRVAGYVRELSDLIHRGRELTAVGVEEDRP
jgi:signal transduction histidine kinase